MIRAIFLLMIVTTGCVTHEKPAQKGTKVIAGNYHLSLPEGWTREHIPFPISFAPSISYEGTEDAFFSKGWGDKESQDYWCYAFLWSLSGRPVLDSSSLSNDLKIYYDGLVSDNVRRRAITPDLVVPTEVTIAAGTTETGDSATYIGSIHMLDYLSHQPMILHCKVHYIGYDTTGHTAVFFAISPKTFEQPVWQLFKEMRDTFGLN